jgi:AmmeMemoRadiSam system protein B
MSRLRPPAVAGIFYPADATELRRTVARYINSSPANAETRSPKAVIVPHAGYPYSGPVAGCAYRLLRDTGASRIRHVVLLGPSHRVPLRGLAVPGVDGFVTPLGVVPIDAAGRQRLRELGLAGIADAPHASEHSLEVELPFLQCVIDDFDLLPIAAGLAPAELVARALEAAWNGPDTLIVISTDLSHYHTAEEARNLDDATTCAILERRSDLSEEQACGSSGVNGLMQVARRLGLTVKLLDQRNSGDTAGDRSRVVGYGSYAVFEH